MYNSLEAFAKTFGFWDQRHANHRARDGYRLVHDFRRVGNSTQVLLQYLLHRLQSTTLAPPEPYLWGSLWTVAFYSAAERSYWALEQLKAVDSPWNRSLRTSSVGVFIIIYKRQISKDFDYYCCILFVVSCLIRGFAYLLVVSTRASSTVYSLLVFTKSVDSNFRAIWLAPVTRNVLGYSLFCERREKWPVVSRKFQKKKLKKRFLSIWFGKY